MLSRLFHGWERRLAAVTKDRTVHPFEWGLDWLPLNGHSLDGSPSEILTLWAARVMRDTDAFFHVTPISEYTLEGDIVSFPSAYTTPHASNNLVTARYFAATKDRRDRAVVVLPQWNAEPEGHVALCRWLAKAGISALRLTLPYHDSRMPPELRRADYIVSPNIGRTVQVCRQAVLDARLAVGWLERLGYSRIGILGTSLGSCLAMLTAAHDERISAAAFNHISPFFADVVWHGLSTAHVRAGLDGKIDLPVLRSCWAPISPQSYVDRLRHKHSLLVYATYDLTFPVALSRQFINEFRARNIPHEVAALPCGHYTTGVAPFKWLDGHLLVSFLRRNL